MGALNAIISGVQTGIKYNAIGEEAKAGVAEDQENKLIALNASQDAKHRGNLEAARTRMNAAQIIGKQKTGYAEGGVDASVGTPADVMLDTRTMSELDAKTQQNNAALEAWGYKRKAEGFDRQTEARVAKMRSDQMGTILSGFGDLAKSSMGK